MIATLRGTVELRDDPYVIVEVHGVGYQVHCARTVLAKATTGASIKIYTHTHVREDVLELYGFDSRQDLKLFEYCIGVSGIGCKTAIGIFSIGGRLEIMQAITRADVNFFTSVPRLGKKNAQRLIIELKSKIGDKTEFDLSSDGGIDNDVVEALKTFGFSSQEAQAAFRAVEQKAETTSEKIRLALKYLGK